MTVGPLRMTVGIPRMTVGPLRPSTSWRPHVHCGGSTRAFTGETVVRE